MWWVPLLVNVFAVGYFSHEFFGRTGAEQILSLSTRGIYLFISFFLSSYLAFVLRCETSKRIRMMAWGIAGLVFSGILGVFLNSELIVEPVDILEPVVDHDPAIDEQCRNTRFLEAARCMARVQRRVWDPLVTLSASKPFEAVVEFDAFPNEMASYLERAARGDVRLLVDLYLFRVPPGFESPFGPIVVTLSDSQDPLTLEETTKHVFTPSQAARFSLQKRIVFTTILPEGQVVPIPPRSFFIRNPEYRIPYRRDYARFDGKPFAFPRGDTFLATFHFETLQHVPLAVFF